MRLSIYWTYGTNGGTLTAMTNSHAAHRPGPDPYAYLPQVPSFEYPLAIGLIELEEGTRVVANIEGVEREALQIGLPVEATFVDFDDELSLPVFRPMASAAHGAA